MGNKQYQYAHFVGEETKGETRVLRNKECTNIPDWKDLPWQFHKEIETVHQAFQ